MHCGGTAIFLVVLFGHGCEHELRSSAREKGSGCQTKADALRVTRLDHPVNGSLQEGGCQIDAKRA